MHTLAFSADLLRQMVKRAGSQESLARLIGVSTHTIHRWVNCKSAPKSTFLLLRIEEIAKELDIN